MNFKDQIRNELREKEALQQRSCHIDVDGIVNDCIYDDIKRILDWVKTDGSKKGSVVYENGEKIFRIHASGPYYLGMITNREMLFYLHDKLSKSQTYPSRSGFYELRYFTDIYMSDDEWGIDYIGSEAYKTFEKRKTKIGFFGSNYKYEWRITTCSELDRYMNLFRQAAAKEGIKASLYANVLVHRSEGLKYVQETITIPSVNEWHEYSGNDYVDRIQLMMKLDVVL